MENGFVRRVFGIARLWWAMRQTLPQVPQSGRERMNDKPKARASSQTLLALREPIDIRAQRRAPRRRGYPYPKRPRNISSLKLAASRRSLDSIRPAIQNPFESQPPQIDWQPFMPQKQNSLTMSPSQKRKSDGECNRPHELCKFFRHFAAIPLWCP
jgi:hypothetical protein